MARKNSVRVRGCHSLSLSLSLSLTLIEGRGGFRPTFAPLFGCGAELNDLSAAFSRRSEPAMIARRSFGPVGRLTDLSPQPASSFALFPPNLVTRIVLHRSLARSIEFGSNFAWQMSPPPSLIIIMSADVPARLVPMPRLPPSFFFRPWPRSSAFPFHSSPLHSTSRRIVGGGDLRRRRHRRGVWGGGDGDPETLEG